MSPNRHLEEGHLLCPQQGRAAYLADQSRHLARHQVGNFAWIGPVFVAEGQVIEQVFQRLQPFSGKGFGALGADSLHVLHRAVELEHELNVTSPAGRALVSCLTAEYWKYRLLSTGYSDFYAADLAFSVSKQVGMTLSNFQRSLAAVLLGNLIYFAVLMPILPAFARHGISFCTPRDSTLAW